MKYIFGIGGGSDFETACMVAETDDFVLTALAPLLLSDGNIDWDQTLAKYTGRDFRMSSDSMWERRDIYKCFSVSHEEGSFPLLKDHRRPNSFGIFVPSRYSHVAFRLSLESLKFLVGSSEIVAVDTGGDSLRGLVPGMGDTDLSPVFGGAVDSRDVDALALIGQFVNGPFKLLVIGPGADGETSKRGLQTAFEALDQARGASARLIRRGNILDLGQHFSRITDCMDYPEGSTLSNIKEALAHNNPTVDVPVTRVGRVVQFLPVYFLSSVLELEILPNPC
jgi:hypothetical protein